MSVLVVGLDHRTAPVWIRERLAYASASGAARDVAADADVREAFVLSTCNRVELYVSCAPDDVEAAADRLIALLAARSAMSVAVLRPYLMVHHGDAAARQLCRVAAGMESMVVGETQITAQIRRALAEARRDGAAGRVLHRLVTTAFAAGRRARPLLPAAAGPTSVAEAAVRAAGGVQALADRSVVVVGAGATAADVLRALAGARPRRLVIVNRALHRAAPLAARHGAALASWEALGVIVSDADVVFACTAAASPVIGVEHVAPTHARVLLDLGVPRNVDEAVRGIAGTRVVDVDALGACGREDPAMRGAAATMHVAAEAAVAQWAARFVAWLRTEQVVPTIAAIRAGADRARDHEVNRALARLGGLTDREREVVREMAARLVNKLLHHPVSSLAADPDAPRLAEPARRLFGLTDGGAAVRASAPNVAAPNVAAPNVASRPLANVP